MSIGSMLYTAMVRRHVLSGQKCAVMLLMTMYRGVVVALGIRVI